MTDSFVIGESRQKIHSNQVEEPSAVAQFINTYVIKPSVTDFFITLNTLIAYFFLLFLIADVKFSTSLIWIYPVIIVVCFRIRKNRQEKEIEEISHRIPFFADAIANSLSVGGTLEQAFEQSVYYLRGDFKLAFEKIMLKNALGNRIGPLLHNLDHQYPKTGLKYLICLLEEYKDLGVGISPLLKRIATVLKVKEEAEEKVKTILAGGSTYAKMSILIFGLSFLSFGFLLKDQVHTLFSDQLRPALVILLAWSGLGMFMVVRLTSMDFTNRSALRPSVKPFMERTQWTIDKLLDYCGFRGDLEKWRTFLQYLPIGVAFIVTAAYGVYQPSPWYYLLIVYGIAMMVCRFMIEFILKGIVEDQLMQAVETFPDYLQVFVIGLNSGLNQYKALEFAENAVEGSTPEVLQKELVRTRTAISCGESNTKTWQHLINRLPFETVTDFSELMIISPLHGESIIKSVEHLMSSYQSKKLNLVEKKATKLGQMVIPIIVVAFFPLFLFAVFGPLWVKISKLFG